MLDIDEEFYGYERIDAQEKEQRTYMAQFKKLNIQPRIVSDIYSCRNNDKEIQNIKDNLESKIIKK